jgi:mutator protein MutT
VAMVNNSPLEWAPYLFPVSVKGVVLASDQVVLLKNERNEWELPGGKLELGETPEQCVVREIAEELNLTASVDALLDTWVYNIGPERIVLIVTFGVVVPSLVGLRCSHEHKECRIFPLKDVDELNMPTGYKLSISRFAASDSPSSSFSA